MSLASIKRKVVKGTLLKLVRHDLAETPGCQWHIARRWACMQE
jgi:hypothetical protein